ncbi:zinc finger protein 600 [Anopheles nili]|uniref:zinc finger protein 600 n=1 Tax=Anopheles nili TaxID=185578 RepID=UPI00237A87BE|nr:zinc finger protein 600 [Anopheles nili]
MPSNHLSQRYNIYLHQANQNLDDTFCRLFWSPFANVEESRKTTRIGRNKVTRLVEHKNHRKNQCSQCGVTFRWPAELKYHHAYLHEKQLLNVCPEPSCRRNFQFPYQLVSHQRSWGHHDWHVACPICDKRFGSQRFLARHTALSCKLHQEEHNKKATQ